MPTHGGFGSRAFCFAGPNTFSPSGTGVVDPCMVLGKSRSGRRRAAKIGVDSAAFGVDSA